MEEVPKFRGTGAGKFLIGVIQMRAKKELKAKELHLICHNTNTKALLLYRKLGFQPYGLKEMNGFDHRVIAGILMKIAL